MLFIAAITQRIDQYFCNLANHHFYICTIWCVYFYQLLSFLFKNVIRIPCPYFLFWFFLNWPIIVDMLEKNKTTGHKHMDGVCVLVVYKSITSGTFVIAGPSSSFFCTKMSKTRATLKFLAVFLKGVKCRGYINAKIQITLDTNSSWAICYLCIPRWTAKQNKTKQSQKWPEISSVQMCEKNIEIPPPSSPPFWLTLNSQRILRILIFWKKKKEFRLFSFITQKISPIREL